MKNKNTHAHTEQVTVISPEGQVLNCTRKAFLSVYQDKGFQLAEDAVRSDRAEPAPREKRERNPKRPGTASPATGSAAEVAAALGMTGADNAAEDVKAGDNAVDGDNEK